MTLKIMAFEERGLASFDQTQQSIGLTVEVDVARTKASLSIPEQVGLRGVSVASTSIQPRCGRRIRPRGQHDAHGSPPSPVFRTHQDRDGGRSTRTAQWLSTDYAALGQGA